MKRTARYYKTGSTVPGSGNPKKAAAARKKKAATDKKINARPEQKAKRVELQQKRREAIKKGADTSKTDYDHKVKKRVPKSVNRGRKGEGGRK